MRAEFINPFLHTIVNILTTMANLKPKVGKASLKKNDVASGVVTGYIDLMGEQNTGSFAISFSEETILDIADKMLGEKPKGVDGTITDLVGELTNMVSGGARNLLSEEGYNFHMATPQIYQGEEHRIQHKVEGPKILLPFKTGAGEFFVEICFRSSY